EPFSLIRAPWPEPVGIAGAEAARAEIEWLIRLVSEVRAIRAEMHVPPATEISILLRDASPETLARTQTWIEAIRRLARASDLRPLTGEMPKGSAQVLVGEATFVIPLAGVIDLDAERGRLEKEIAKTEQEAGKIEKKLGNRDFVSRAPEQVVEENRERLQGARQEIARLRVALSRIE
ncbi:MAG: valine--tRNA ligase, partial [Acetobacteraceae bacterium]|nr:valine--tRNA ligase [Acetobacteraceae bacterium]